MSLQAIVLSLISDIDDPAVRTDVASTIFFLRDVYMSGGIKDEDLRLELANIVSTVLDATHPELLPDEKQKKVETFVNQLMRAIKMSTLKTRLMGRYRPPPPV